MPTITIIMVILIKKYFTSNTNVLFATKGSTPKFMIAQTTMPYKKPATHLFLKMEV